jgi:hypothetical protein
MSLVFNAGSRLEGINVDESTITLGVSLILAGASDRFDGFDG